MKITHLFAAALVAGTFTLASCGGNGNNENHDSVPAVDSSKMEMSYNVNMETSKLSWKGEMLGVYSHTGNIKMSAASLKMAGGAVTAGSFTIDMKSMVPTDSGYNKEKTPEMLVGHLSSPDFFDVATNPTSTFEIKSVEGNTIKGMLTVRGKSNEETITDVVVSPNGKDVNVKGKLTFDRQKYGVAYKATMKDMVLSDNIMIEIDLNATQQ
jgi:polyisoprenoid-binding protein YceI